MVFILDNKRFIVIALGSIVKDKVRWNKKVDQDNRMERARHWI
jgi:hypothetical protein